MKSIIYIIVMAFSLQTLARGGGGFKVLDELNLSSDQLEKVAQYKTEQSAKRKAKKGDNKDHREKMKQLFLSGASDKELRDQHKNITASRSGHTGSKLEKMIFLKNLLTKEQRKVYIEKGEARREDSRKSCGKRGHRKD